MLFPHPTPSACPVPAFFFLSTTPHASFIGEKFCQKLQVVTEDIIGLPLASIVDPRDAYALEIALSQVLNQEDTGGEPAGTTVHVRLACGALSSCEASMTVAIGSEGLVVVTRVYGA